MTPQDVIDQTNEYRVKQGLKPLKVSPELSKAAEAAAKDMSSKGYFSHNAPDGTSFTSWPKSSGYNYKYIGQNLANGYDTATDTLAAWKVSPAHNANLTKSQYSDIGVAFATGTYNGKPSTYVIQYFGSPDAPQTTVTPMPTRNTSIEASAKGTILEAQKTPTKLDMGMSQTTPQH